MLENMGPKVNQYFIESDAEGRPFHRKFRSIIFQRAKQERDTQAFGTQMDVYKTGYEWMGHSIYPLDSENPGRDGGCRRTELRRQNRTAPCKQEN